MPQSSGLPGEGTKKLEQAKGRAWKQSQAAASCAHLPGCTCSALQEQGMVAATRGKELTQEHPGIERQVSGVA